MKKRVLKHTFYSPSKINLFLYVKSRRPDGFHNLHSLMQTVDLCDVLEVSSHTTADVFSCSDAHLPMDTSNFVIQALELFRKRTQIFDPIKIHLTKKIPKEAGLAGGSGNAATLLWALNKLFQTNLDKQQLMQWASEVSSDAPFFFSQGRALVEGFGEKVYEQTLTPTQELFLVKPQEGLSTRAIFQRVTLKREVSEVPVIMHHNDLEEPAFMLLPKLKELMESLNRQDLGNIWMTGSGTTLVCERSPKFLPEDVQCFPVRTIHRSLDSWYHPSTAFDNSSQNSSLS